MGMFLTPLLMVYLFCSLSVFQDCSNVCDRNKSYHKLREYDQKHKRKTPTHNEKYI